MWQVFKTRRANRANHRQDYFRPSVEQLEDRCVPAVPWPFQLPAGTTQLPVGASYGQWMEGGNLGIHFHEGVDIRAARGTNVLAVSAGRIGAVYNVQDQYASFIVVRSADNTTGWNYLHVVPGNKPALNEPRTDTDRPWEVNDEVKLHDRLGIVAAAPVGNSDHLHLDRGGDVDPSLADNPNPQVRNLRRPIGDPLAELNTNNDDMAPMVTQLNFRVAEHDRDGILTDPTPAMPGRNEASRADNQYFYQPAGQRFVALGRRAPTRDVNLNPGGAQDRGNIDIIAKAWDRFGTGDNSDDIGVKTISFLITGQKWGRGTATINSFDFDGQFIREEGLLTAHTYAGLRNYEIARTVYENDQQSDSRSNGPYWYTVTNTRNVGGETNIYVSAEDRQRYWNSDVEQGNPWNAIENPVAGAPVPDAARNATSAFPDDIYDIRVVTLDNKFNPGHLTVTVVLDNWEQTIGTDKATYAPNDNVMVQTGEQYTANQQLRLHVLGAAPTEGGALAAGTFKGTTTTNEDGIVQPFNLEQFVVGNYWLVSDYNGDGVYDSRLDAVRRFTVTGNGEEGGGVGDFAWDDLDGDGLQSPGEPGLPEVTVNLLDELGGWLDSTTTDAYGFYSFTNLAPGTYSLEFIAPSGYGFTWQDAGDDGIDSDADPITGRTAPFTLSSGQNNTELDAGLYQKATVGDFVWDDLDGNGLQDPGEPGYDGVTVRLLDQGGAVISSTSTSGGGFYSFPDLIPGTYSLEFVAPAGYGFTAQDAGDDALDSDPDTVTGRTAAFTLSSGQDLTTLDAGLFLNDLPEVTGVVPNFGPFSGGTTVTITGLNFLAVTDVSFGGTAATFTVDSSTQITATAPPHAAGTVDVTVTTASGTSPATPAGWFTYVTTPIRTEPGFSASTLGPTDDGSAGPIDLGFTVDFFGQLYSTVYVNNNGTVTFNGPLDDFTPFDLTTTTIPILAPFFADVDTTVGPVVSYGTGTTVEGHAAFAVNWIAVGYFAQHLDKTNSFQLVLIDRSDLAPGAFDVEFNYGRIEWETGDASYDPEWQALSARAGYANGSGNPGTYHELAGSGVNGAFLDSETTTGLIHNSENSGVQGRYFYEIRGGGGGGGGAAAFSGGGGTAPAAASAVPVVRGVKAVAGPTAGGTRVSILGSNFTGVSGVFFGTTPASSFTVLSPRQIVATAPPHAAGTLNVRVTTASGSSLPAPASRFSYVVAPVVTALSQTSGSTRGGTAVTLTGTNFTGVTAVLFGTTPARSFRVLSPTQIAVIAPPQLPGTVEVRVAAAGGVSTASPVARYTYVAVPRVTGLSRTSGPTAGGFSLTLTGANFLGVTAVFFGSRSAAFTVQSPTRLTVVVPPGAAGPMNVRIVAAGGSSPVSPATRFTYVAGSAAGGSAAPAGSSGSGTLASDPLEPFSVDLVMALQYDADSSEKRGPS